MEFQNQVKDALKELPPADRLVAIALKNIYDRIKALHVKEEKEITANRLEFVERYRKIQQRAASIINGRKIEENELANPEEYFIEEQKAEMKTMLASPLPLKQYWLVALKNSRLQEFMAPNDQKLLAHLTDLSQKVTETTLQICLTFNGSTEIEDGSYTRLIQLNNGMPVAFKGDKIKTKENLTEGLLFCLSKDSESKKDLSLSFEIITYLVTDLIPYSLRFFLGEMEYEGEDEEDEEGEEEEGDEEDEDDGQKGRKKKN